MSYVIALAGNPNCGKTTLFNDLTGSRQRVGNWPGVTVDKKEGTYKKNKEINIMDLPGTYSLSPYSAEEIIARDYIVMEKPDAVIDIVDATSIERNLYLTLQIIETGIPTVVALNMMDEVEARGDRINAEKLSEILGVPVVPIVARKGKGVPELMAQAVEVAKAKKAPKKLPIFDDKLDATVAKIKEALDAAGEADSAWKAVKLLENDEKVGEKVSVELKSQAEKIVADAYGAGADLEAVVADQRYQYISKVVKDTVKKGKTGHVETTSDKVDKILTNRILTLPIFAVVMYILFACTNSENFLFLGINSPGIWLAGVVETAWGWVTGLVEGLVANASPWVYSLVIDGIMGGIGAVLGFLPLILVLYVLVSFLEDCGYMARVAFVLDRIFRKFGLSGRAFIPLLQGFGCSVPAVMATRTMESEKDRKITTILCGFMPCGAKLPIFALIVSTLFADSNQTAVTYSLYVFSIVVAIIVALLLNKLVYKDDTSNFIMELPQYRIPTVKTIALHGWEKVKAYAQKAGTVIFVSTILIWFLSNFNIDSFNGNNAAANEDGSIMCEMDDSFMASLGGVLAPIFTPQGFNEWRPAAAIVTGWIAKENVVVTFSQLYSEDVTPEYLEGFFSQYSPEELEELGFEGGVYDAEAAPDIYSESILFEGADENALPTLHEDIPTKSAAYAYMVFNLLCMPCFAAVGAMKRELKTWKELGKAVGVQMLTAYVVSLLVNVVGGLFMN